MTSRAIYLCVLAAITLALRPGAAQQKPLTEPVQSGQDAVKLRVDLVLMDAQVVQKKTARIIGGLEKSDFTLYEDGVKQQITQFGTDTLPLSVLLLVDRAGCLDPFSDKVRDATLAALNRLKPSDEVALMAFAEDTELVEGFRLDRQQIADAIQRMPPHREVAKHCFNNAFYKAAQFMSRASNPAGRRVIIMITGVTKDLGCLFGPSATDTRNAVLESGAVVCGLIPSTSGQRIENGIIGGIASVAGVFKAPVSGLNKYVDETGGEIFSEKPEDLDKAFGDLIDHLRNRYTIGFVSTNPTRDGTYRKLKLQLSDDVAKKEGQVVVITRRGYLAKKDLAGKANPSKPTEERNNQ